MGISDTLSNSFLNTLTRLKKLVRYYDQIISLNHRREIENEKRRKEQMFMALAMMDAMGISNPAAFYTLELVPYMIQDFHEWHQRHGWENSPLETVRCC